MTQILNQGKTSGNQVHQQAYKKYSGTATSGAMGSRRRDRNHTPQKNNSIQNSVGNEENWYPVPDLNKTTINVTKELSNAHKNPQSRNLERNL
jgi:hypothetical protein